MIDDQLEIELDESHLSNLLKEVEETGDNETAELDQTASTDDDQVTLKDVAETRYKVLAWA